MSAGTESSSQAIDLKRLNLYTGGNSALNKEILELFVGQARANLERLEDLLAGDPEAPSGSSWREIAHTLKGAARSIGADNLAEAACEAEKTALPSLESARAALANIRAETEAVIAFIEDFCRRTG